MAAEHDLHRQRFLITGQVQGVGFRPFVYRLASELGLTGWVRNDARGVTVEVQGPPGAACGFAERLKRELPPLARIDRCEEADAPVVPGEAGFVIRPSEGGEVADAQVTVDTAVCADCLREMNDPADPRWRYPFINCTNCGPRYTIVRRIPYDRANTTMAGFAMCPLCAGQYADPADRRFHAQPVACPVCGPHVWLADARGQTLDCADPIAEAAGLLEAGRIVAVKGLGGFHLACRADDDGAVRRLRRRKRRDAKPLAIMIRDIDRAAALCRLTPPAEALLAGPIRPIVLLPRRPDAAAPVAPSVAEGLDTLGVMLPYTPLHHLLLAAVDRPLVMTSANFSDEPLVKDNDEAVERLCGLADALLLHNRPIERRLDDSVVQLGARGRLSVLRRARGYAPVPVRLRIADCGLRIEEAGPPTDALPQRDTRPPIRNPQSAIRNFSVLAVGAELKNAVCLYRNGMAVLGEHVGDLKDARTYRHFIDTIAHLEKLFEIAPDAIACDTHPLYLSTEYALRRVEGHATSWPGHAPCRLVRVQHHHAHAAGVLAEHGRAGPAIGLVCDGVGHGEDGAVWGGEVLLADLRDFRRLGHLRYVRLPGGDKAAEETFRPALGVLYDALGEEGLHHPLLERCGAEPGAVAEVAQLLRADANCPRSSSLGRWFDAAAFLCGLAKANRYEGEAPMLLEAAAAEGVEETYEFRLVGPAAAPGGGPGVGQVGQVRQVGQVGQPSPQGGGGPFEIDLRPMVAQLCAELLAGAAAGAVSARFHNTVAAFLLAAAGRARQATGVGLVVLSGGCFANRYLTGRLVDALEADGFEVLTHQTVPTNDGGIALGQAAVAAARLAEL